MEYKLFSYRFAQEILQHENYSKLLTEILDVVSECPLYIYPNKSAKNANLDVVQQLLNAYFDIKFHKNND